MSPAKDNKAFCVLPWVHMYVSNTSDVFPCCTYNYSSPAMGSIKENSLQEAFNSEAMKGFRLDLLNGKTRPDVCDGCYIQENTEGRSFRTDSNERFSHLIAPRLQDMNDDGGIDQPKWAHIDFRVSNVCNLKCRTCNTDASSSWEEDYRKLKWPFSHSPRDGQLQQKKVDFFETQLDTVESFYFAGGEPLLMRDHYRMLERLIERGRTHVLLQYNTNFTTLKLGKWDVLDFWKKFPQVHIAPSLDHYGTKAEYVRKNTRWVDLLANIERVRREVPHVRVTPSITVSIFNILDLEDFLHALHDSDFLRKEGDGIHFNVLRQPGSYSIQHMPQDLKKKAESVLAASERYIQSLGLDSAPFAHIRAYLREPANPQKIVEFFKINDAVDQLRQEKFGDLFPEVRTSLEKFTRAELHL